LGIGDWGIGGGRARPGEPDARGLRAAAAV